MENTERTDLKWTEARKNVKTVVSMVENELTRRYSSYVKNARRNFYAENAGEFYICALEDFFVVAYKEEDGDCFFPSDYDSLESLMADVIGEIEQ